MSPGLQFSYIGAWMSFAAYQTASGNDEMRLLYASWIERWRFPGRSQRYGLLAAYLLSLLTITMGGGFWIGTLQVQGSEAGSKPARIALVVTMLCILGITIFGGRVKPRMEPTLFATMCIAVCEAAGVAAER